MSMKKRGEPDGDRVNIDFGWLKYVSVARLGFSHTETMWLSFGEYQELYQAYMRLFDVENMLHKTGQTYEHLIKAENEIEKPIDFDF